MKSLLAIILLSMPLTAISQSKTYTIAFLNSKDNAKEISKDSIAKLMEGHMANITRLANEGKLLAAGPFDGGGGLFILNTTSLQEAESWVKPIPL